MGSVEVKNNGDGTCTVTAVVSVDTSTFPWTLREVKGKDGKIEQVRTPDPEGEASVIRQRACQAAATACLRAAVAESMSPAKVEEQRAKDIAEANARADALLAQRPKEK